MKKIIFFHLYNDISGSPQVLSMVIRGLQARGYAVELFTSNTEGFLSGIEGVKYHQFSYKWTSNRFLTLLRLVYAQLYMFIASFQFKKNDVIFYINTICPFAPAYAAKLRRIPVVYHVHEVYVKPNLLHKVYFRMWRNLSSFTFFVSQYVQKQYAENLNRTAVVYNALPASFSELALMKHETSNTGNILMISSLKEYKGLRQFILLASRLPQYRFRLIVNCDQKGINSFFDTVPPNLEILPSQRDVHPFFREASLLLNLSIPSLCVETFGLTILEAMAYGIPVICPPVGGPLELVDDDMSGFRIDSRNIDELSEKIRYILESGKYAQFSANARIKSFKFSEEEMIKQIDEQLKRIE
nr:glycosyltransferase family 4 protein [uncultured Macellibacteroides sp.]